MTRVSVIVPVYNGAAYLGETLASIAAQTVCPDEVIVVDDGSTDASEVCVQACSAVTKYIRNPSNRGVCHSRNVGLGHATGDLIAFSDQDDLWHPEKLERQATVLSRDDDLDFLFTNFHYQRGSAIDATDKFSQAGSDWWECAAETTAPDTLIRLKQPALPNLLLFQPVFPSTVMLRRSLLDRAGCFDEALGREQSEDLEFLLRCDLAGRIAALSTPLAIVRKHGHNYSSDTTKTTLSQIRILRYMLSHDPRYEPFRPLIERQLVLRSIAALHGSFAAGDLSICRELIRSIPRSQRGMKLQVKALIAALPSPVARLLRAVLLS